MRLGLVLLGTWCGCAAGDGVALRARPVDAGSCVVEEQPEPVLEPTPVARSAHRYFGIRVLDQDGGAIAGAELETVHHVTYRSDRNGRVAFYEPGLMDQDVFFTPRAEGYTFPKDGFGYSGRALRTVEGGEGELRLSGAGPVVAADDRETQRLASPVPRDCFAVRVVDRATQRGVPLVFLDGGRDRYVTDSQGMSAICELGPITLTVTSHGYTYAPRQVTFDATANGSARIELTRDNLAERLYRSTGAGIYRDSELLGLSAPLPALRGGVLSQDGVGIADLGDQLLWTWGVTDRASYPLGNFSACAALGTRTGAPEYLVNDEGFCRSAAPSLPPDNLTTWLTSTFAVDGRGYASYVKPDGNLAIQGRGLVRWNGTQFEDTGVRFTSAVEGQTLRIGDYLYFASPVRVRASDVLDASKYEPVAFLTDLRDRETGTSITANGNPAQAYSSWRERYVRIFAQRGGSSSFLGEVWYAESDTPLGPWVYAQKIVSHDAYTFYGPFIHDVLPLRQHGRLLTFEGTYTDALAGDQVIRTPRYNRNQLVYQLDLALPALPVPIYEGMRTAKELSSDAAPIFYAPDRQAPGTVPFAWSGPACAERTLVQGTPTLPIFYAYSGDARPSYLIPLEGTTAYVWPAPSSPALPVASFRSPLHANAGPDQCLTRGQELVLDASASTGATKYTWTRYDDACARGEGATLRTKLAPGLYSYLLEIEDAAGHQSHDSVIVQVR